MFEMSDRSYPDLSESEEQAYDNYGLTRNRASAQMAAAPHQKIVLPRGSGQSRFAPPPYYYLASEGGVMPSWIIDDLQARSRGRHLNS
jgi:hypothetical protein